MARKKQCEATYDRHWLKQARQRKGFTQKQVAEAAGFVEENYCRFERGYGTINIHSALKIAKLLDFDPMKYLHEEILSDD